jgi:hypothetical protein
MELNFNHTQAVLAGSLAEDPAVHGFLSQDPLRETLRKLWKYFKSNGPVRFPPLGGGREGFSMAAITHPDIASFIHPLFASRKERIKNCRS